jgi:hypothetical protein
MHRRCIAPTYGKIEQRNWRSFWRSISRDKFPGWRLPDPVEGLEAILLYDSYLPHAPV